MTDAATAGQRMTTAESELRSLLEGNARFVDDMPRYRRDIHAARAAAARQLPWAAVFTCIDSRVTAESLFDCDFGQLIVTRTAGHVPDRAAVGSLEFAVTELRVPLVVVLGHERCGAIQAAVDTVAASTAEPHRRRGYLVEQLWQPAAQALDRAPEQPYAEAMRIQVRRTVADLRGYPALSRVRIVGARYDLDNGRVHLID